MLIDSQYLLYVSLCFLLAVFMVMHQYTKTNSLCVKTFLAIKSDSDFLCFYFENEVARQEVIVLLNCSNFIQQLHRLIKVLIILIGDSLIQFDRF